MKRFLTLFLAMVFAFGLLAGCGGETKPATNTDTTPATTEATEPTQPGEEGKNLKILTLGNSGAVDCGHMLAHIAAAEGYENFKLATLYYSGCSLTMHVGFMSKNESVYKLYVSSTAEPNMIPTIMNDVSMEQALRFDYWDIVVMQESSWDMAGSDSAGIRNNIQLLQKYVRDNCMNPNVKVVYNSNWAGPTDNVLRDTYPNPENNVYYSRYVAYGDDRSTLYNAIIKGVQNVIVPDDTFEYIIPSGTAMENAFSSYWEEKDIHRDYWHATDRARVMVSYVWLCRLFGIEQLAEIKLDKIPVAFFKSIQGTEDYVLTASDKAIILESVNNALKNPFAVTPSQYTTAP